MKPFDVLVGVGLIEVVVAVTVGVELIEVAITVLVGVTTGMGVLVGVAVSPD